MIQNKASTFNFNRWLTTFQKHKTEYIQSVNKIEDLLDNIGKKSSSFKRQYNLFKQMTCIPMKYLNHFIKWYIAGIIAKEQGDNLSQQQQDNINKDDESIKPTDMSQELLKLETIEENGPFIQQTLQEIYLNPNRRIKHTQKTRTDKELEEENKENKSQNQTDEPTPFKY